MVIDKILTSVPDKLDGGNIFPCTSRQSWKWDGVNFSILHPDETIEINSSVYSNSNNRSCILKVDNDYRSILLPGDIEAVIENSLIEKYASDEGSQELDVDILVAPHHGSKTSSTDSFIQATSPDYALFSAGYKNRYGHPAQAVIKTYQKHNIKIINTASTGAIRFRIGKTLSQPDQFRQGHGHFWNRNHVEYRLQQSAENITGD